MHTLNDNNIGDGDIIAWLDSAVSSVANPGDGEMLSDSDSSEGADGSSLLFPILGMLILFLFGGLR
jgi:hypothetical protein